jgi:hypothetical protein
MQRFQRRDQVSVGFVGTRRLVYGLALVASASMQICSSRHPPTEADDVVANIAMMIPAIKEVLISSET